MVVDRVVLTGQTFAGDARENGFGVGFLVETLDGLEPHAVPFGSFVPVANGSANPVFP